MNKYYAFRKLMDFVTEEYEITDADMNNIKSVYENTKF